MITNIVNGKQYVGQTYNYRKRGNQYIRFGFKKRFEEHLSKDRQTKYLSLAIKKYGSENFKTELLTVCNPSMTNALETAFIRYYETLHPAGYNGTEGGDSLIPCDDMKRNISSTLKKYYDDETVKKNHSTIHTNKFKDVDTTQIENIEINPIKEEGHNKIVYMYIKYKNVAERIRRRYGGIHLDYNSSLLRCKNDALKLVNDDESRVFINDIKNNDNKKKKINGSIIKIEIKIHKIKNHRLTSVYITTDETISYSQKQRFVFGGKNIDFVESYNSAIDFVNEIRSDNIEIIDNISLR